MKRRLLMVGRTRYALPLPPSLERKFDALSAQLDVHVLAAGTGTGDERFSLVRPFPVRRLEGPAFYAGFPFRVARELRRTRPAAVLAQGGPETALALAGRALARVHAPVVMDLHGDPSTSTRLYGSPLRRVASPVADALTRFALRRADAVRTLSPFTSDLVRRHGVEPAAAFPAFMDLEPFLATPPAPLPDPPVALFVGVLERYKAFEVLAQAWERAAGRTSGAQLHVVGRGSLGPIAERLVAGGRVRWSPVLATDEVARALDEATVLLLPSRSEGLPRVVVEAFCRGRGVIGSRAGGIPDIVRDGENGLLVPVEDAEALADAIVAALSDADLAARLAEGARRSSTEWVATPEEYARRVAELVEQVSDA